MESTKMEKEKALIMVDEKKIGSTTEFKYSCFALQLILIFRIH